MTPKRLVASLMLSILTLLSVASGTVPASSVAAPEPAADFAAAAASAYGWLAAQQDSALLDDGSGISGLVDSFEDYSGPDQPITEAFTYDQAVAAIAFLVIGDTDRARIVLDTLRDLQADDGSWCNSYWYGGYWGAELRKHVGPAVWVALAIMNYERLTGDLDSYHGTAIAALDWALSFQRENGGIAGGETTWDVPGVWTEEVWTGTEHNLDAYPALVYFAQNTPDRTETYMDAAAGVLAFLEDVVWDAENDRFFGGFKNDTGLVDPYVPLDVNPWAVLALGTGYAGVLDSVDAADGDPDTGFGTLDHPRYVQTLTYDDDGNLMTGYDFDWQDDGAPADPGKGGGTYAADIWIEGTLFMACAHFAAGNAAKADAILAEVVKKMGAGSSLPGGLPYSLKASNNHYWRMLQQNCVSSTAWFVIAAVRWNPFQGEDLDPLPRAAAPTADVSAGHHPGSISVALATATPDADIRYTLDGTLPDESSPLYDAPVIVASDTVLTARSFATGFRASEPASWNYLIGPQARHPEPDLPAGLYAAPLGVVLTTPTDGATIRYTLDGSLPDADSPVYDGALVITSDTVLTASAFRADLAASDYMRATYAIGDALAPPSFSVPEGAYDASQTVSVTHPDAAVTLRYTLDGSVPDDRSPIYAGPFVVTGAVTIRAIATKTGAVSSPAASATYDVTIPHADHALSETASSLTIAWLDAAVYVDIHYLVDGIGQQNVRMVPNPATDHPEVTIPGLAEGADISYWFTVMTTEQNDTAHYGHVFGSLVPVAGTVSPPAASVPSGTYAEEVSILLSTLTGGAEIRYAVGADVLAVHCVYDGAVVLQASAAIAFYAAMEGLDPSAVVRAVYVVTPAEGSAPYDLIANVPAAPDGGPTVLATVLVAVGAGLGAAASGLAFYFFVFKKLKARP